MNRKLKKKRQKGPTNSISHSAYIAKSCGKFVPEQTKGRFGRKMGYMFVQGQGPWSVANTGQKH